MLRAGKYKNHWFRPSYGCGFYLLTHEGRGPVAIQEPFNEWHLDSGLAILKKTKIRPLLHKLHRKRSLLLKLHKINLTLQVREILIKSRNYSFAY